MGELESKANIKPSVTKNFKMAMVVLIFFITCFHLYEVLYLPDFNIISDRILLGTVLLAITYLWTQEVRDRRKLEVVNEALLSAHEELKAANISAMKALIMSEEARDPYLTGHSRRVTEYALSLANRINMEGRDIKHLEYAGYLHDIGKLGISDAVLHKPGKLNNEEWLIMKKHPEKALDILAPLKFLPEEKVMIRHHHERYDGKGYPDGLKGEDIPLGSRILAVTDSFDAMNSKRPYRPPMAKDAIILELKNAKGTQFDPKIIDIFLDIIEKDETIFSTE